MAAEAQTAFFSYNRDDSEFALRLAEDLKAAGASVWLDQLDIAPGQQWDRTVEEALSNCPSLIVILSPASVDSTNVLDEVSFALETQKTVIPILYRDCVIPFRLRRVQHIDFRTDYERGLKTLLKTLSVESRPLPPVPEESQIHPTTGEEERLKEEPKPAAQKSRLEREQEAARTRLEQERKRVQERLEREREGAELHAREMGEAYAPPESLGQEEADVPHAKEGFWGRIEAVVLPVRVRYVLALLIALGLVLGITFIWKASPEVQVTQIPPAGEGGSDQTAPIAGTAKNVDFGSHKIVVYAFAGGIWWEQPNVDAPLTSIEKDGGWITTTHLGSRYKVLLVDDSYRVFHQATDIPNAGPGIVASITVKGKQD